MNYQQFLWFENRNFWKKPENWSECSQAVCTTTFVIKVGSQSKQKLSLQSDLSTTDFSKLNITELHPNRRIDLHKEFYIMSMYSIYMYICIYTYIYCIKPSALSNRYIEHPSFVGALCHSSSLHSCPPSRLSTAHRPTEAPDCSQHARPLPP